jgi:oligopeptide/dipeptide ABC transporter ATP-binding protein
VGTPLLSVDRLRVEYQVRRRAALRAVDDVTFRVGPRETVGLVGESGSGKTTIASAVLGFAPPVAGAITFDGEDITAAGRAQRRRLSASLQVVFQDPYSSLNPSRTIGQTLAETLRPHGALPRPEVSQRVSAMLGRVGLDRDAADRYPGQFSGGQRQRVAIARALIARPRLVICDEAVSSLDLSVQAQVLNLLRGLQGELGLSYLFISHDLGVVRHVSSRVVVLYRGRVMESGPTAALYRNPAHPYTRALLDAAPVPDPGQQQARRAARRPAPADQPGPLSLDACQFAARCRWATDVCRVRQPQADLTPGGTYVACHHWRDLPPAPG